jgi:hypothetical protein
MTSSPPTASPQDADPPGSSGTAVPPATPPPPSSPPPSTLPSPARPRAPYPPTATVERPPLREAYSGGPDEPARSFTVWDAVGVLVTAFAMLAVNQLIVAEANLGLGHSGIVQAATAAVGVAAAAGVAVLVVWDRPTVREAVRRLTDVWRDPPGDWVAAVIGAILAVPLLRLYAPVLFNDSDSARIVAAVTHVPANGIGFLRETQDNFLPQVLLGPVVAVGGLAAAKLFVIASVQVLAGVVAYLTRRMTASMWGAAAAAVATVALPPIIERATYLPMYPTMLVLGYVGSWLAYRAITVQDERRWGPWRYAVPAGVCLALAPEAHAVGQLFYLVPLMLVVFAPGVRAWLLGAGRIYLAVLVVSLPRIAVNLSVGGLDRFPSYRTDYWITNGYVREIQIRFWNYVGVDEPLGEYVRELPDRFVTSLGDFGWLLLALAGVAWLVCCRGRARWFVLGALAFVALAVTVKRVPPFPRYYAPLVPGIALLVGVGVGGLARVGLGGRMGRAERIGRAERVGPGSSPTRWAMPARLLAAACTVALVVVAMLNLDSAASRTDRSRLVVERGPFRTLAAAIDDGKGVIGARSHSLLFVTSDIPTYGGQFLSEDEYATYLTWPSDEQVIEVLERHDIGWVLIHGDRALETTYHDTWLIPNHGRPARQVDQVAASPRFCKRLEVGGFILYQLGACD